MFILTHIQTRVTDAANSFLLIKKKKKIQNKSFYPPTFGANAIYTQTETALEERAATVWHWLDYSLRKISGLDAFTDRQKANELQQAHGQTMERAVPTKVRSATHSD